MRGALIVGVGEKYELVERILDGLLMGGIVGLGLIECWARYDE